MINSIVSGTVQVTIVVVAYSEQSGKQASPWLQWKTNCTGV